MTLTNFFRNFKFTRASFIAEAKELTTKFFGKSRREIEHERLRNRLEVLVKEKRMREDLVSTLSHDLRTPLSAAQISIQLIQRSCPAGSAARALTECAQRSLKRADGMIRDLLDVNRLRSGQKLTLEREALCLNDLIRATLQELRLLHPKAFFQLHERRNVTGSWNANSVRRILENLCSNAVKYGRHGAPIAIYVGIQDDAACLEVQNFGNPIAEEELPRLFDPYRRLPGTGEDGICCSWGLGLTLVRGLTEAHGGRISATSSVEAGTVFTVQLPLD